MKPWRRIFTYVVSLPPDLLWGWPAVLLIRLFWGEALRWEEDALVCQLREGSWPLNPKATLGGWYAKWGGTTLSPHAIFYTHRDLGGSREHWTRIQHHEHHHVEQGEAMQFMAAVICVAMVARGDTWLGLAVWSLGGYALMGAAGWVTAWLRGEQAYRGSFHEEAAYAQAKEDKP